MSDVASCKERFRNRLAGIFSVTSACFRGSRPQLSRHVVEGEFSNLRLRQKEEFPQGAMTRDRAWSSGKKLREKG